MFSYGRSSGRLASNDDGNGTTYTNTNVYNRHYQPLLLPLPLPLRTKVLLISWVIVIVIAM